MWLTFIAKILALRFIVIKPLKSITINAILINATIITSCLYANKSIPILLPDKNNSLTLNAIDAASDPYDMVWYEQRDGYDFQTHTSMPLTSTSTPAFPFVQNCKDFSTPEDFAPPLLSMGPEVSFCLRPAESLGSVFAASLKAPATLVVQNV